MHFTNGRNCCNYGSRLPAIWFWWQNTTRLHTRSGTSRWGNNGGRWWGGPGIDKESTYQLPIRHWTRVRVVVYGNYFRVYYDKNTDNRIELGNNFENVYIRWVGSERYRPPVSNVTVMFRVLGQVVIVMRMFNYEELFTINYLIVVLVTMVLLKLYRHL